MTDWQPIETAPQNTPVLVLERPEFPVCVAIYKTGGYPTGWVLDAYDAIELRPTHWMPLPPIPTT